MVKEALIWITEILNRNKIPFQITGGLAAQAYGSKRPLYDIDIDVPEEYLPEIAREVKPYVIFGPARYRDDEWDLQLLKLDYKGQLIDIGGAGSAKYFDKKSGSWKEESVDFSKSELKGLFGLKLPVVGLEHLKKLKLSLARDVDIEDLKYIS